MAKLSQEKKALQSRVARERDLPIKPWQAFSPPAPRSFRFQPGYKCPTCGENRKSKIHKAHINKGGSNG